MHNLDRRKTSDAVGIMSWEIARTGQPGMCVV
jgi:hypothetical protein